MASRTVAPSPRPPRAIAEIGSSVGYPDAFYFSRQFRVVHEVSPSEFRRRAQAEASGGGGEPVLPAARDPR